MKLLTRNTCIVLLSFISNLAFAEPNYYVTHNSTNVGTTISILEARPYSFYTAPHSSSKVEWWMLQTGCNYYLMNSKCKVIIKTETNFPNPVDVGILTMDMRTGELSPKYISTNGYTISVIGAGEIHIYKNP